MDNDASKTSEYSGVQIQTKDDPDEHLQVAFNIEKFKKPNDGVDLDVNHDPKDERNGKTSFDVEGAYNESSIQLGTIVTDKRKNKQTFGSMLHSAFDEWLNTTKKKVRDTVDQHEFLKPKEVPKIEVAELRKGVIQEAAQHAKQAPRDDHAIVIEKIRTFAHDAEQVTGKPFLFKPSSQKHTEPSWSQLKEAVPLKTDVVEFKGSQPSLMIQEEPDYPPSKKTEERKRSPLASYAQHFSFSKKGHEPQPIPAFTVSPIAKDLAPKIPTLRVQSVAIPHPNHANEQVDLRSQLARSAGQHMEASREPRGPSTTPNQPLLEHEPSLKRKEPLHTLPPIPIPAPEKVKEEKRPIFLTPVKTAAPNVPHHHAPFHLNSRALLFTSITVIGASLGIFVAFVVTQNVMSPSDPQPLVNAETVPSFLTTDAQIPVPLPITRSEFLDTLRSEIQRTQEGVVHTYPVITTDSGSSPASTKEIMEVLSPRAPGSFLRSLGDDLMIGGVGAGSSQPYLVLRSSNFDVAFAGMLEWEREMSNDLSPLFGTPVLATLSSVSSGGAFAPHFIDALESSRSIRILYDESGTERIVYAIVNNDLIIITTTTEALATLVERVQ